MGNVPPITLELMWEAEDMLSDFDHSKYIEELGELILTTVSNLQPYSKRDIFRLTHATAEQRAKAWLKVNGGRL